MRKLMAALLVLILAGSFALLNIHISSAALPSAHELSGPSVHYVLPGGSSAVCSAWDDACDLQVAIALAQEGDEIWVGAGTYKPTSISDPKASFTLKAGVAIYGGFLGTEDQRDQRDWVNNESILSGEIGNSDLASDNSYHVVTTVGLPETTILDGFSIEGGYTYWSDPDVRGGGVYNREGSMPVMKNLIIRNNHSVIDGAGMYNSASNPTLSNIIFIGNTASSLGGGMSNKHSSPSLTNVTFAGNSAGYGGGMYNDGSSPSLVNVTFTGNTSRLNGAGMTNWISSTPTLTNVTFQGNVTGGTGGAMFNYASSPIYHTGLITGNSAVNGGGIYNTQYLTTGSHIKLTDVRLENNTATSGNGGAMYSQFSNPILKDVEIVGNHSNNGKGGGMFNDSSSPQLTDVIISGNTSKNAGGGMYNTGTYEVRSNPTLTRVRFTNNVAQDDSYGYGGGIYNYDWCSPTLTDVVFEGNFAGQDGGGLYNSQVANPVLRRVLFAGNFSDNFGGGMFNTAAYPSLENVTFAGNTAYENGGGMCSWAVINPISMVNVTFVGNESVYGDGDGLFSSEGNGFSITNGIFWGNGDQQIIGGGAVTYSDVQGGRTGEGNINTDPLLGLLADNGGFSFTLALEEGSPAIDAGSSSVCSSTDQRGYYRPIDGDEVEGARCDMGAYEYRSALFLFMPVVVK